ncbi:hypothetical protein N865_20100 [Intrasporangium oryzae NRRL B-24470]|uniref:Alpha/beta hydrolase fold-5 domain-containing protein n=1 Tax=Intrasporangium oryzae NRRL B-24470 TaxID=1386089 RepID=W9G1A4_9MICO|nr:hypothetical protein N865_20100 [Intrasporangium oryzae NRRL B-24470]
MSETPERPSPPRPPWWSITIAALWLAVPLALLITDLPVLRSAHPAHLVTLVVAVLVGAVLVARALRRSRSGVVRAAAHPVRRTLGRILVALATVVVLGALFWLRPFAASDDAVAAMAGGDGVRVTDSATRIEIAPTSGEPRTGLVFQPGARVDPRAYVRMLSGVSRAGTLVVIVKQPYQIGFLAIGAPGGIIAAHPEVKAWSVGGHSLGGVAASSYAADHPTQVHGILFWASYPLGSLADRTDLHVASVSGTKDGLATPADIAASKPNLPPTSVFTPVEGAVHAFFGDYGEQPGDGTPTVTRADAQRQIVDASVALMGSLQP